MANPFQPYPRGKGPVKAFVFGDPGSHKTRRALSLPGPRYMIDLEKGADEYGDLAEDGDFYLSCQNAKLFNEAVDYVCSLRDRVLVIVDPVSMLWEILQSGQASRVSKRKKQDLEEVIFDQGIWGRLNRSHADPLSKLISSPHDLVMTGRGKVLKDKDGNATGYGAEGHKSLPFIVKTVIETHLDHDVVHKDRSNTFRVGRHNERLDFRKLREASGAGTGVKLQTMEQAAQVDSAIAWEAARPNFVDMLSKLVPPVSIEDFERYMSDQGEGSLYSASREELIGLFRRVRDNTNGIRDQIMAWLDTGRDTAAG